MGYATKDLRMLPNELTVDELTAEERMLLDPKLMAKQIREAEEKQNENLAGVKNPAYELMDDALERKSRI